MNTRKEGKRGGPEKRVVVFGFDKRFAAVPSLLRGVSVIGKRGGDGFL